MHMESASCAIQKVSDSETQMFKFDFRMFLSLYTFMYVWCNRGRIKRVLSRIQFQYKAEFTVGIIFVLSGAWLIATCSSSVFLPKYFQVGNGGIQREPV